MIGQRVRVILNPHPMTSSKASSVTGTLKKMDAAGAIIFVEHTLPEGEGNRFFPMHRIQEIVDLGRAL